MRRPPPHVDPAALAAWCHTYLGSEPEAELLRVGHLSTVVGVRLKDGREVAVKVRPPAPRLEACAAVHRRLFDAGFPCPELLVDRAPLGEFVASAEAYVPGGEVLPDSGRAARPFADALAHLIRGAPDPSEVPSLDPAPPWTAWDHREGGLWPWPDDRDVDLNAAGGPGWIDEAGQAARQRLRRAPKREGFIGHGDWYTANLRWTGDRLHVVHDWDSVIIESEPALAGFAAANYPAIRSGTESTIEETEEFLGAYADARGQPFSREELEESWAAGLWQRSYDAKKQFATDGAPRSLQEAEAEARLRRIG